MGKLNFRAYLISRFFPTREIRENLMHAKNTCFTVHCSSVSPGSVSGMLVGGVCTAGAGTVWFVSCTITFCFTDVSFTSVPTISITIIITITIIIINSSSSNSKKCIRNTSADKSEKCTQVLKRTSITTTKSFQVHSDSLHTLHLAFHSHKFCSTLSHISCTASHTFSDFLYLLQSFVLDYTRTLMDHTTRSTDHEVECREMLDALKTNTNQSQLYSNHNNVN